MTKICWMAFDSWSRQSVKFSPHFCFLAELTRSDVWRRAQQMASVLWELCSILPLRVLQAPLVWGCLFFGQINAKNGKPQNNALKFITVGARFDFHTHTRSVSFRVFHSYQQQKCIELWSIVACYLAPCCPIFQQNIKQKACPLRCWEIHIMDHVSFNSRTP